MYIWPYSRALLQGAVQDKNSSHKTFAKPKVSSLRVYMCASEVERVQKYSTQVKVPLHYWNFT